MKPETKIVASVSFIAFAKGRKLTMGTCTNGTTKETFKKLCFTSADGTRTYVDFSANLGELTPEEIVAYKNDLQVVTLDSGTHKLCKQGESTWVEIDLDI